MLHVDITYIGVVRRYHCDRDSASRVYNFSKLSKDVPALAGGVRGNSKRAFSGVVRAKGLTEIFFFFFDFQTKWKHMV